jgi:hypothetical protein
MKKAGQGQKTESKCPFYNDFPVPLNVWDKLGTKVGQGTIGTRPLIKIRNE